MKKINRFSNLMTVMIALALALSACVDDDFDTPPVKQVPVGQVLNIEYIKTLFNDNAEYLNSGTGDAYLFDSDASIYATVTMDNETDNSYRTFYIQDHTGAIAVYQDVSGGVYIGDSVRIYLKDLVIMQYSGLFQLNASDGGGVNVDSSVVKQGTYNLRTPEIATIEQILGDKSYYQGRLVKISDVQFVDTDTAETFASPETLETENRFLQDTSNNKIIVRTSGYSNFAGSGVPKGSGSLIAIVGQFNDDMQLYIRKLSEVDMDSTRFEVEPSGGDNGDAITDFNIDFEDFANYDDIEIEGWQNEIEEGTRAWHAKEFDDNIYAQLNAYNSSDDANIAWLITPPIDFDENSNEVLHFQSAVAYYTHEGFELLISFDYDGEDYTSATWEALSATIAGSSSSDYAWVNSGDIDLSAYTGVGYIAFKYSGDADQGETGTFILDNIVLEDKP